MSLIWRHYSKLSYATPDGTKNYANNEIQKRGKPASRFRLFNGLSLSSIGIGTYRGNTTKEDDEALENAIHKSVTSGAINVIDTAINHRAMKSERSIGRGLSRLIDDTQEPSKQKILVLDITTKARLYREMCSVT